ncbi:hypothetical protein ASZ78_013503 [Callipepla squamata]|uniref:Teneurin N-terminal domain-containing protein n=1 Tax=Callipepla squamata TaxID=9009 RepID=A0A226MYJ2_CALSU|nr:hypothetical protein ASZ78_013503 [Callipepla squamata]
MSPEHPVRLWGRNTKSGRSSCLSSRANSNLTLTDTEHENTETVVSDADLTKAFENSFSDLVLAGCKFQYCLNTTQYAVDHQVSCMHFDLFNQKAVLVVKSRIPEFHIFVQVNEAVLAQA